MSTDLERRFRAFDDLQPTALRTEIHRRMAEPALRPIPEAPRPGNRVLAAAVAVAVFAAAAGFAWTIFQRSRGERPLTAPDLWSWAPEGWTELPLPPEVRDDAALVWTGQELVYWGGWPRGTSIERAKADGFAFDPATRTWRLLPPAPVAGGSANAVWTGTEVLLWDVETADGVTWPTLAFDPGIGAWRRLDESPHRPEWGGAWAWTGREVIVWGGGGRDDPTTVQGAALDPVTGAWRRIADAPVGMNLANAVWTGDEVAVVGSELDNRNVAEARTAIALSYDPETDAWRRLPDAPLSPQSSEAVWFHGRLFAWDYGSDSAQFLSHEERWQGLGQLPLEHGECHVDGVAIDGAVLAWNCGYPDAWYTTAGWVDVEGGPAFDLPIDEVVGSFGRLTAAGSVAVLQHVENLERGGEIHIGSPEAPVRLWVWRPSTSPAPPPPPTAEDAENLVANFLVAWLGYETYLPTLATQDVINRCRDGVGGCAQLAGGGFTNWKSGDVAETTPATFEVQVDLRPEHGPDVRQTFVVGPGTTADGRDAQLVVIDAYLG